MDERMFFPSFTICTLKCQACELWQIMNTSVLKANIHNKKSIKGKGIQYVNAVKVLD